MALKIGDRVRENTSSTGVGGLSLTGAPAGFQRFSAVLASGDTTYYSLEENDKFEIGIGTYGSNNLERTTVLSSSNSGNKISLGGSGVVFITYPAAKAFFASEGDEFTVPSSGLVFSNGTVIKDAKLVELTDVNLSGTPVQNSVFDLNITNKSLSIGDLTGPTNSNNILIGYGAGSGITTGSDSVIIGAESSTINKTGQHNVHIGAKAGPVVSDAASSVYNSVAVGYSAGNKMRHESVAIGYEAALHAYEIGFIGIGYQVGSGLGSYSTVIGYQAGRTLGEDYAVALGYQAGYNGAGEASVWIGQGAGHSSTGSTRSIGIGKNAGKSSSGNECIYIGEGAGTSNSSNNLVFIGNSTPATNGSLVKGDMDAKRIAVGVADVTLDDTFFVGVNSASDEGIVVKAAVSQVSNLTSWKNSSSSVLASVSKDGVVSAHEIVATGNGIQIANLVPASTANKLYNNSGELYFNGSAVGGGDVSTAQLNYVSGIAVYGSGQTILNQNNITALLTASGTATSLIASSGVAAYASGQVISNQSNISTNTSRVTYASGQAIANKSDIGTNTSNISSNTSNISSNTNKVNYASGQAIENESDITALLTASGTATSLVASSGIANYASGQAIANEGDLVAVSGIAAYASGVSLTVKEADGSPNVSNVRTIVVSNGTLTDNGAGQVTVTTGGGGGGGDVTTSQLNYVSGIAVYSSGQAISNQSNITALNTASGIATSLVASSGIATYASGQAIANESDIVATSGIANYASGQAISNQGNITALLTASGTATSLIASSGIATYASGQAIANESDIVAVSGVATNKFTVTASDSNNYTFNGMGLSNGLDPDLYLHKGHTYYFDKQTASHPFRVSATDGGSVYQDAAGNSIEISGQGVLKFEVPQNAPDKLYYYCTSHASNMKGEIYTTNNVDEIIYVSGIANYASGQVNVATDGAAEASKALVLDSAKSFTGVKNGRFSQFDSFVYSTGVSVGNSGVLMARNTPGVTTDTLYNVGGTLYFNGSQLASAGGASATAQYASGQATSLNTASGVATYASGQAIANESDIAALLTASGTATSLVASSGIATYASGQAISNQSNITALNTASGIATSLLAVSGTATSLVASSGIASYASGQAIANESDIATNTSNISTNTGRVNYASGLAITNELNVAYASGQAISNQGNITALLSASGTATSLIASSGIASYASGQAIANEGDLVAVSGIAAYASGVSLTVKEADNSPNVSNVRTIVVSNGTLTDNGGGQVTLTTGGGGGGGDVTTTQLNYVSGIAVYASGQSQSLNTVSGVATSLLAVSGTATSLIASSGIASYASGQAIENEGIATYASGQAIENESDILAVSGIAAFSSGVVTDVDVIIGQVSTTAGTGIAIGYGAGLDSSIDKANALNGYKASDVLIGHFAGSGYIHHAPTSTALSSEQQNVMIGFKAGANSLNYRGGSTALGDNVYIGVEAGHTASGYHRVCVGDEAAHSSSGIRVVAIGAKCFEHSEGDDNTAVGYRAGGHSTGDHNLYLGILAGFGVIGANNIELLTEGPNPSLIGGNSNKIHIENTIIGDTSAKKIAIGNIAAGDLTPDATLEVKPKVASDIGIIVQAVSSHSASLQEWHNSSEAKLLAVGPDGGVELPNNVPSTTTNKLYNEGGTLKFNGSAIGGGGTSAEATYASGQAISNQSNITALLTASGTATSLISTSGIATYASGQAIENEGLATYASGQAISNQSNITALSTASGIATSLLSVSGTATSLVASSGIATYASGQAVANQSSATTNASNISTNTGNISTNTARVSYASGQAISNQSNITALNTASGNFWYYHFPSCYFWYS